MAGRPLLEHGTAVRSYWLAIGDVAARRVCVVGGHSSGRSDGRDGMVRDSLNTQTDYACGGPISSGRSV
jgi:hypothetical protein